MSPSDWQQVLLAVGVRTATAARWSPAFASELGPERFSKGMDDVLALLPQVLHECDKFERLEENLNYSAERLMAVWPTRFPTLASTVGYAHNPQALAEKVYGGRMGNKLPGWAWLYRGQGPVMFTGRDSFEFVERLSSEANDYQDFTGQPWLVCEPVWGLQCTRLWWEGRIPDACLADTVQVRRRVNGGRIGLEHCQQLADACRAAFA